MDNIIKEKIYQSFEKTLDLDLAYKKLNVSEEDRKLLNEDKAFQARLAYAEATKKEELLSELFKISTTAKNEGVRLNALMEIMKTHYTERFGKDKFIDDGVQQIVLYLPENDRGNKT